VTGLLDRIPHLLGRRTLHRRHAIIVNPAVESMKKLTRLSSDDEQRRTINALVQKVQELEAVQSMLVAMLVELGALEEDEMSAKLNAALAPVRLVLGGAPSSSPREAVPVDGDRGGPYRAALVDLVPKVVVCDSCGETMAADRTLYDDFGGCICDDCFNAARLGR
jgi:hypothetical protein